MFKKFEDFLIEKSPDVVVCTHQVCANAAAKARIKAYKNFRIVCVPTDYETEGLWPHKQADLFCVANEQMARTLIARKVDSSKIVISGMPVEASFFSKYVKKDIKEKFGLPPRKKVALVMVGAKESGPYKNIRKVINSSIKQLANLSGIHFVFCVGQDNNYKAKLDKKIEKYEIKNFTVVTYIENLAELMAVSDFAIIKPGGLIITECACASLPVILVGKTFAQENINRRTLVFNDACEHAITPKGLINLLKMLKSDKQKYNSLKTNIGKIGNKNSANVICAAINNIINQDKNVEIESNLISLYVGKTPAHTR